MVLADTGFLQVLENGVASGAIYALIALGYTLVYGIIELINFAHGDVFMWGTVATLYVLGTLHITGAVSNPWELVGLLVLLMVICMLLCAGIDVIVERVAYKPLRHAPRLAPLISAIGASFILENVALFIIGPSPISVPNIFPDKGFSGLGVSVSYLDTFIILFSVVLMVALALFISRTRLGRAMRSVAQDREAASLMGVNIDRIIVITFTLGGALAGAASVVYAMKVQSAYYFTGFEIGLKAFTAAVLGGIGNIYGAMLGGLFIGVIEAFVIQYLPAGFQWADAVVFAILALVLVFRPAGLLGQALPEKV